MAQTTSGDSQTRDSFTSRTAFIIACIGSAVGLSGIWLFPYRVSQLGGAAFLIPYLFFVVLLLTSKLFPAIYAPLSSI